MRNTFYHLFLGCYYVNFSPTITGRVYVKMKKFTKDRQIVFYPKE